MTKKIEEKDLEEISGGRRFNRAPSSGRGGYGRGVGSMTTTLPTPDGGGGGDTINVPPDTDGGADDTNGGNHGIS